MVDRGQELVFKEKVEAISKEIISSKIVVIKGLMFSFLAGFTLFIGAGIIWKDNILRPIAEFIYPVKYLYPKIIEESLLDTKTETQLYEKMKNKFLEDSEFSKKLINDEKKEEVINYIREKEPRNIHLRHLPSVDTDVSDKIRNTIGNGDEIKQRIWKVLESGNKDEFRRLVKSNFGNVLEDEFYEQMTFIYETLPTRNRERFAREMERKGAESRPVNIKTIASKHNGKQDSCSKRIDHSKFQAVVVIPKLATERMYRWLHCPTAEFPFLFLKITAEGIMLDTEIEIIGVSRGGLSKDIELRVTQAVVKKMNIAGWEKYQSNSPGTFKIVRATF